MALVSSVNFCDFLGFDWEGVGGTGGSGAVGEQVAPDGEGFDDFPGVAGGAEFPDERASGGETGEEGCVVEGAGERGAVVAGGPLHVMDRAADDVGGHAVEPVRVVEQSEVVFELDVAGV